MAFPELDELVKIVSEFTVQGSDNKLRNACDDMNLGSQLDKLLSRSKERKKLCS